jgi:hypothetical protein
LVRAGAVSLLKEMVTLGLIRPSVVSVGKNKQGTFSLMMKPNGNLPDIKAFLVSKDLILSEGEEKGICTIC